MVATDGPLVRSFLLQILLNFFLKDLVIGSIFLATNCQVMMFPT